MQVSFLHSHDGGAHWIPVVQSQCSGTGGGVFDPVSSEVAYLDYGLSISGANLVRLTDNGRRATKVGELNCDDVSLAFTSVNSGLAICVRNATTYQLLRTSDGGVRWSNTALYGD